MEFYDRRQWLYREINGAVFQLCQGDITEHEVDAIVSSANSRLAGGGGVDGAIHRVGGPSIMAQCVLLKGCPTGEAISTGAGNLKAKMVIHAVGPSWSGGDAEEESLLRSAYLASLRVAKEKGATTVAFPSISTGSYGFPVAKAAEIAVACVLEVLRHEHSFRLVRFVLYSNDDCKIYDDVARELIDGPDFGCWWNYFQNSPASRNYGFLNLSTTESYDQAVLDLRAVTEHPHWEEDSIKLLGQVNWRGHLAPALSLYLSGCYRPAFIQALWSAVKGGSWVIPQLLCVLGEVDKHFEDGAKKLISERLSPHQPAHGLKKHTEMGPGSDESRMGKAANSLLGLADLGVWEVEDELRSQLELLAESDIDNAGAIIGRYLPCLRRIKSRF